MTQHEESALALAVNARDLRSDCGCQFKGLQLCANSLRDLSELSAESCQVTLHVDAAHMRKRVQRRNGSYAPKCTYYLRFDILSLFRDRVILSDCVLTDAHHKRLAALIKSKCLPLRHSGVRQRSTRSRSESTTTFITLMFSAINDQQ